MTHSCPLPVDWLDYLDDEGELGLAEHLASCRSCQTLIASLRVDPRPTFDPQWAAGFKRRTDAIWHEDRPACPAPAEFWFSSADFEIGQVIVGADKPRHASSFRYHDVDRILVLVLTHPEDDHLGWLDVVPVLSDIESATDTDVVFSSEENTLGAPWRALFAYQLRVARDQLDTRVGALSGAGIRTLSAALAGEADDARWGVPLQHADDPRGRLDDELDEGIRRLRTPWLLLHDMCDGDEEIQADNPGLRLVASTSEHDQRSKQAKIFWLAPADEPAHGLALAAASSPTVKRRRWAVEQQRLKLVGKLDVDWQRGDLVFVVIAADLHGAARVRLHVIAAGREHASEPFVPTEGITVSLVNHVTTAQVEKIGAEVLS